MVSTSNQVEFFFFLALLQNVARDLDGLGWAEYTLECKVDELQLSLVLWRTCSEIQPLEIVD